MSETPETETENPETETETPKPETSKGGTGYAAYDVTLQQFVSGVHKARKDAKAAANVPASHRVEVRKV